MAQEDDYHTTPIWQDECRASINAAKTAHNLTDRDKSNLVMDAIYRAKEFGHLIEMDDFMKLTMKFDYIEITDRSHLNIY